MAYAGYVIPPHRPGQRCTIDPTMAPETILLLNGDGQYLLPRAMAGPDPRNQWPAPAP